MIYASPLVKILVVVVLVIVFFLVTIINLKTKKPEGCEEENKTCSSCAQKCIYNKTKDDKDSE